MDLCEFEANLVYRVSSRTVFKEFPLAVMIEPVLREQNSCLAVACADELLLIAAELQLPVGTAVA